MLYSIASLAIIYSSLAAALPLAHDAAAPNTPNGSVLLPLATEESKSLDRLRPSNSLNIYLGDTVGAAPGQPIAVEGQLQLSFASPAVNLDNSDSVTKIVCSTSNDAISLTFNSADALKVAQDSWSSGVMLLDAYGQNCGREKELHLKRLNGAPKTTGLTLAFGYKEIDIASALTAYEAGWGPDHAEAKAAHQASKVNTPRPAFFDDSAWPSFGAVPEHATPKASKAIVARHDFSETFALPSSLKRDIPLWHSSDSSAQVICKGCGLGGHILTSGSVDWSIRHPKEFSGKIVFGTDDLDAHLEFQLSVGKTLSFNGDKAGLLAEIHSTLSAPFPGFSIAGVITIGPSIDIQPFLNMYFSTTGTASIGGDLKWHGARLTLDINDHSQSNGNSWGGANFVGFANVNAQLHANAGAGIRFAVHIGVEAFKISKGVSVGSEFSVKANADLDWSAVVDTNGNLKAGFNAVNGCLGVDVGFDVVERVYLDVDLKSDQQKTLWQGPQHHAFDKCWTYADIKAWFGGHQPSGM